jgi:serine/threonine-protein kinase HipA
MMATINASWYATARQACVSGLIRSAFVYEGFGFDLNDPMIATHDPEELPTAARRP